VVEMTEGRKRIIAVHLLLTKGYEILLLKRKNTGWMDGYWSVPAGHIEENESIFNALRREVSEEIGLLIKEDGVDGMHIMSRFMEDADDRIDFFFHVEYNNGVFNNLEPDKCEELKWFVLDDLPGNIVPYVHHGISYYYSGLLFSAFQES
jgi:8-oxo-dGTP pyrophosphatase MutT (NUDIX family)